MLVERKACCPTANAFSSRWQLILLISRLKMFTMSKICVFGKKLRSQWVNQVSNLFENEISNFK